MIFAFMSISLLGPSGRMGYILDCLGQVNADYLQSFVFG